MGADGPTLADERHDLRRHRWSNRRFGGWVVVTTVLTFVPASLVVLVFLVSLAVQVDGRTAALAWGAMLTVSVALVVVMTPSRRHAVLADQGDPDIGWVPFVVRLVMFGHRRRPVAIRLLVALVLGPPYLVLLVAYALYGVLDLFASLGV